MELSKLVARRLRSLADLLVSLGLVGDVWDMLVSFADSEQSQDYVPGKRSEMKDEDNECGYSLCGSVKVVGASAICAMNSIKTV